MCDWVDFDPFCVFLSCNCEGFVTQLLNALSTPEGRESDLYISFLARNPVTEEGT